MDAAPRVMSSLTWTNVYFGLTFIFFNAFISTTFHLGFAGSLLSAAFKCMGELTNLGGILQHVFESNSPWAVAGIVFVLNFLGTFEAVANRSKKRYHNMFLSVLLSMLGSTVPVSIIGTRYAMAVTPFWTPAQYIPILGILCGNVVSGVVMAVAHILEEIYDNRDKVEAYLALGASRFEVCIPIAREALRVALTPTINQMSVIGIIHIPSMMTGVVLGGTSVEQAAKLQMIMMFLLSASTTLAAITTTVLTLSVVVDSEHRVRPDRIDVDEHPVWRAKNWLFAKISRAFKPLANKLAKYLYCCRRKKVQGADGGG